jgi:hypothetical protein
MKARLRPIPRDAKCGCLGIRPIDAPCFIVAQFAGVAACRMTVVDAAIAVV